MDEKLNETNSETLLAQPSSNLQFELSDTLIDKPNAPVYISESSDEYETDDREVNKISKKIGKHRKPNLLDQAISDINEKMDNLRSWYELVTKDGIGLHRVLIDLENMDKNTLLNQKQDIHDRTVLFESTANAMVNSCSEFLQTTQTQAENWADMLQQQVEQRDHLQRIVEQLANHQDSLVEKAAENQIITSPRATLDKYEDHATQLFDATEIVWSSMILPPKTLDAAESRYTQQIQRRYTSAGEGGAQVVPSQLAMVRLTLKEFEFDNVELPRDKSIVKLPTRKRRSQIPERPNLPLNLWSFMKNCIGKDLAHVPMPVNFNEPISMLQRLAENFEYANLLDKAAECEDECLQLAYVAAFSVSNYSSTADRIGKPFNPLLGETYECDRIDDLGWRSISEQVSHHPPISVIFCEGFKWVCYQEFTLRSKFRVKYLQVMPNGNTFVEFKNTGHKYMWRKVTTTLHNIVVGKLWVDQEGVSEIIGLKAADGLKCVLDYIPYSYFSTAQQRCVKGTIIDRNGDVPMLLRGSWDSEMGILPVVSQTGKGSSTTYKTGDYTAIWNRTKPVPGSEKFYHFTAFSCQLNEWEDGVAPTDSRRRLDQRLMEEGRWDESTVEKTRLEEKQRDTRRKTENYIRRSTKNLVESQPSLDTDFTPYQPVWFNFSEEEDFSTSMYVYNGTYWEAKENQDWSKCPDIYS